MSSNLSTKFVEIASNITITNLFPSVILVYSSWNIEGTGVIGFAVGFIEGKKVGALVIGFNEGKLLGDTEGEEVEGIGTQLPFPDETVVTCRFVSVTKTFFNGISR